MKNKNSLLMMKNLLCCLCLLLGAFDNLKAEYDLIKYNQ